MHYINLSYYKRQVTFTFILPKYPYIYYFYIITSIKHLCDQYKNSHFLKKLKYLFYGFQYETSSIEVKA